MLSLYLVTREQRPAQKYRLKLALVDLKSTVEFKFPCFTNIIFVQILLP